MRWIHHARRAFTLPRLTLGVLLAGALFALAGFAVAQNAGDGDSARMMREVRLSGSDVKVETAGSDKLILRGRESDLETLKELIEKLDQEKKRKDVQVVTLAEKPAAEVASTLQAVVQQLYGNGAIPEEDLPTITPLSTNILLVTALPQHLQNVVGIIEQIDVVPKRIPAFEPLKFAIKHRLAQEVATELKETLDKIRALQPDATGAEVLVRANDADNSVTVINVPVEQREQIQNLIDTIDVEPGGPTSIGEVQLVVYPILNSDPETLAELLRNMFATSSTTEAIQEQIRRLTVIKFGMGGSREALQPLNLDRPLRILADQDSSSLIVATVEANIEPIGEIIRLLDSVPLATDMDILIHPFKFADATKVQELLQTLFEEGRSLPGRPGGEGGKEAEPPGYIGKALVYNVGMSVDTRTNTLLFAGRPDQIALAREVILKVDVPMGEAGFPLRLIFLEKTEAPVMAKLLNDLWEQRLELLNDREAGAVAVGRERIFVATDVRSNALIVSASPENFAEIEAMAAELDKAADRALTQIRVINCTNTSAADLKTKIDELWQRKADLRGEAELPADPPVVVTDVRSNSLVIASSTPDFEEIADLVATLERQPLAPIAEIRLLALTQNDATQVGDMLTNLFEQRMQMRVGEGQEENPMDRVAVAVDAATNTLLVAASPDNFAEIQRIVAAIDIEPPTDGLVEMLILENADAQLISDKIKELFEQGIYNPGFRGTGEVADQQQKVAIIADPRANAIIVSASRPNIAIVKQLVAKMDTSDIPLLKESIRTFAVKHADVVKLAGILDRLFEGIEGQATDAEVFKAPTIVADDRSNSLIVSGSRDAIARVESILRELDGESVKPTTAYEIYSLRHASATRLVPRIKQLFEERTTGAEGERTSVSVQADAGSNSIIVGASVEDQVVVRDLLDLLDRPSAISRQFAIFPLKNAEATTVAEKLEQLFQAQGDTEGRVDVTAVQAYEPSNAIIVWASPSEMENITQIVERMDRTDPTTEMMVKVIQLKQAKAEDFATQFTDTLFGGEQGDQERAVILSYDFEKEDGTVERRKLVRQDITVSSDARTNSLMVMAPADSMGMLEAMIRDIDRIRPVVSEVRLFPLLNADAEEMVARLEEVFGEPESSGDEQQVQLQIGNSGATTSATTSATGEGSASVPLRFSADRRTNTVIAAGSPIDLEMVEELVISLDAQDQEDRVAQVYEAKNVDAVDLAAAINDFNQQEQERMADLEDEMSQMRVRERSITAISDEGSNSVIFGVSPRYQRQLERMVGELDRMPPQVMVSVLIAEVSMDDQFDFGVEFAAQDLLFSEKAVTGPNGTLLGDNFDFVTGTDIGAAGVGFGGFTLTVTGEDFNFLLRALQRNSKLNVLSRPVLMIQNNETGRIQIGDQVPIPTGQNLGQAGAQTQVTQQDVGIIVEVTPHINPDGFVTLEIAPEVSQLSNTTVQISEALVAPVISQRNLESVVTVKDGETIVLGGLITTSDEEGETRVPWVSEIPILGEAFKTTAKRKQRRELLVVLTVNVVENADDAFDQSVAERDRMGAELDDSWKKSPLMQGLRIQPRENGFGPKDDTKTIKPVPPARRPGKKGADVENPGSYGPKPAPLTPPPVRTQPALIGRSGGSPYAPTIAGRTSRQAAVEEVAIREEPAYEAPVQAPQAARVNVDRNDARPSQRYDQLEAYRDEQKERQPPAAPPIERVSFTTAQPATYQRGTRPAAPQHTYRATTVDRNDEPLVIQAEVISYEEALKYR